MTKFFVALALAAAVPMTSVAAQTVKQEARELRAANKSLNHDQRDRRQAVRQGDSTAVRQETREIRAGQRDVKQERRDVKRAVIEKKRNG
jgi:hypothetical protein